MKCERGGPRRRPRSPSNIRSIRAPFDAVVLTKNADVGDIVTPIGAAANAKASVVTRGRHGLVEGGGGCIGVEPGAGQVGQPCEIQLDAIPGVAFQRARCT